MKKYKNLLGIGVLLLLAAALAWYIADNWDSFQKIELSDPVWLLPTVVLFVINIYAIGVIMEAAIEPHGVMLSRHEILGLSSLTRFANNVTPSYLGTAIRALYLKKKYGVSYAKFTSSFAVSNILQLMISGVVALLILIYHSGFSAESDMALLMLGFIVFFVALIFVPVRWLAAFFERRSKKYASKRKGKIFERLSVVVTEYDKVRSQPKIFFKILIWTIVSIVATMGTIYYTYLALGLDVPILSAIFIAVLASWAIVFAITPGNVGVSEGLVVAGAQLMGVSIPVTIAMAILRRLIMYLVTFLLATYYAPKLLNTSLTKMSDYK